ncbi:MAG: hypothetical protein WBZ33_14925 [Thermoactinomyces sp.]
MKIQQAPDKTKKHQGSLTINNEASIRAEEKDLTDERQNEVLNPKSGEYPME